MDDLYLTREEIRVLNAQLKPLEAKYANLKERLIESLKAAGTETARTDNATATFTKTTIGNVVDWDTYFAWERKTNRPYLRERRISQAAFRDYLAQVRGHKPPPGMEVFEKEDISLRNR